MNAQALTHIQPQNQQQFAHEFQIVLKKDKICEMRYHIDDMRSYVIKYFDSLFDMIDDFVCVFQDKLSDQETIVQKLIQIVEKKQTEIDERGLYRMGSYVELLSKEIEKQLERVRDTNLSGQGKYIEPQLKIQYESQTQRQLDVISHDQQYKDIFSKPTSIFRKKIRQPAIVNILMESQKIQAFLASENFQRNKQFYEQNKDINLRCLNCTSRGNIVKCHRQNDANYVQCEKYWNDFYKKFVQSVNITLMQSQTQAQPEFKNIQFILNENNAPQNLYGRIIVFSFDSQIKLLMRMDNPFKANYFIACSFSEKDILPESESKYEVFRYLTYQLGKVYAFYESLTDFPIGLLLMQMQLYQNLFEENCKSMKYCKKKMLWEQNFGFMPPLYRDIWIKNFANYFYHNQCYTFQRSI